MKLFRKSSNKDVYIVLLIMGWMSVIEGPLCIGGSVLSYIYTQKFLSTDVKTVGTVIELSELHGERGTTYAPVYTFIDTMGDVHKIYSDNSSYPPQYEVGEEIQILYDPMKPQKTKIDSFFGVWGVATILAIFGVISTLLGPLLIFIGNRIKTKSEQ